MKKTLRIKNRSTRAFEDHFRKLLLKEFYEINKQIAQQLARDKRMPSSYKSDSANDVLSLIERLGDIDYSAILNEIALDVRSSLWKPLRKARIPIIKLTRGERDVIDGWVRGNSLAIDAAKSEMQGRLYRIVADAYERELPQKEIASKLSEAFSITQNKSKFWAVDMLGNLNAELSAERDRSLGVEYQVWRTTGDGKVRASHMRVDGKRYHIDKGLNIDGRMLRPGEDYNCRCYGETVIEYEDVNHNEYIDELLRRYEN